MDNVQNFYSYVENDLFKDNNGARGSELVEALRYKPEGRVPMRSLNVLN
jgi:hypothetical protein